MTKHLMGNCVHLVKTIWYVLAKPFVMSWYVLSKNCLFRPPRTILRTSRFQV